MLKDRQGKFLADHDVGLDSSDPNYSAFIDMEGFLKANPSPDRWLEDQIRLMQQVGSWMGREALESVGERIAKLSTRQHSGPGAPWTSGQNPPAPENADHVAPLPRISDAPCMVPRRGDRGKPARRLSALSSSRAGSQAARGTPEEESQAKAVGRRDPNRPRRRRVICAEYEHI